jgi:hypothetical protein
MSEEDVMALPLDAPAALTAPHARRLDDALVCVNGYGTVCTVEEVVDQGLDVERAVLEGAAS